MSCTNCGTSNGSKPNGCNSNGGCSTGGCNRMNVFDWLSEIPLQDSSKLYPIIEVSFNNGSRKEFFRNNTFHKFKYSDWVAVEGIGGYDVGQVSLTGELVKQQMKKYGVSDASVSKRVLHPATEDELIQRKKQKEREAEILIKSRSMARNLNLEMKLCEVEVQADSKKGTFFYTADQRVDFRELIKIYANDFKMKVEMRQIGARQESGKVGGVGSCGRELCCSTWLIDFKSVNTNSARYQNLSINQTKLSGQCGRLKCCLNYELDTYMDALSIFPDHAESIETVKGTAYLQKRDIFKNLMWYSYPDNNKQYPLSIVRVKEIIALNKNGQKVEELLPIDIDFSVKKTDTVKDAGFINDVGQISIKSLDKASKKKKSAGKQQNNGGNNSGGNRQNTSDNQKNLNNKQQGQKAGTPQINKQNPENRQEQQPKPKPVQAQQQQRTKEQQESLNKSRQQQQADSTQIAPQQKQNLGNQPQRQQQNQPSRPQPQNQPKQTNQQQQPERQQGRNQGRQDRERTRRTERKEDE